VVQYKREWPRWKVPNDMLARQPELEPYSIANGGMEPGLNNPLGARALYLFENGEDTLYRIHGSPEAASIGKAVSSGCIRLLNQDVIDLYDRVPDGARVVVRPSRMPDTLA
jgi:lipoprotein-anchoring transpeptidase ErfK/SrfK